MCYSEASRPVATDLRSAVTRLRSLFEDLAFEAAHESVYASDHFRRLDELIKLESKYREGVFICDEFLNKELCANHLLKYLIDIDLEEFSDEVKSFMCKESENGEGSQV